MRRYDHESTPSCALPLLSEHRRQLLAEVDTPPVSAESQASASFTFAHPRCWRWIFCFRFSGETPAATPMNSDYLHHFILSLISGLLLVAETGGTFSQRFLGRKKRAFFGACLFFAFSCPTWEMKLPAMPTDTLRTDRCFRSTDHHVVSHQSSESALRHMNLAAEMPRP